MLKNNKVLKIILVTITILSILLMLGGNIFASGTAGSDFSGRYLPKGGEENDITRTVGGIGNTILSIFQAVGTIIAVIMLVWLGIKYIMASPEGKADLKGQLFPYLIGCVLLFAGAGLIGIIANVANEKIR